MWWNKNKQNVFIGDTKKLDRGFLKACDAVVKTLGAEGKLALLDNVRVNEPPSVTKDGVTVMQHIRFQNKTENFGALQAIEGCSVTLQKSGDSTTTTAAFMQGFLRNLNRKKFNKKVEKGIKIALDDVNKQLSFLASPLKNRDIKQIIKTSVNNDESLTNTLLKAFTDVGVDGTVEVVKSPDMDKTTYKINDGMFLDKHGYADAFFKNHSVKFEYDAENVNIICAAIWEEDAKLEKTVRAFYQNYPSTTPLVIFTERHVAKFNDAMLNLKHKGCNICVIPTQEVTEVEGEMVLQDIALLTGSNVYNNRDEKPEILLGIADKLHSDYYSTTITVKNQPKEIDDLVKQLEKETDNKYKERLKRLRSKVAVIQVGGINSLQIKEEFDRVEDAIASVKSSKVEGYIVGGGATLVHIASKLNRTLPDKEMQRGYDLLKIVLRQPAIKILENANRTTKQNALQFWRENYLKHSEKEYGFGYNAAKDEVVNLLTDGVIDSKKSIRIALESATERAIQMFNIDVVVHFPEDMSL